MQSEPPENAVLSLLACPYCGRLLQKPTTLFCGHSLCAHHLPLPRDTCPIRDCTHSASEAASQSRRPASSASSGPSSAPPPHHPARLDVTLNKVLTLVARTRQPRPPPDAVYPATDSESDDDEQPHHSPARPRRAVHRRAISPPQPARRNLDAADDDDLRPPPAIRRRLSPTTYQPSPRHSSPDEDEDEDDVQKPSVLRDRESTHDRIAAPDRVPSPSHQLPPPRQPSPETAAESFEKTLLAELMCEICFTVFNKPITTPCQHTFCSQCLQMSLDHSTHCPLCREDLPLLAYYDNPPQNLSILKLFDGTLPLLASTYQARTEAIEAEARKIRLSTPIFVGQLSFPGMPTLLHFFEPRFRVMLRRCLEFPKPMFGMIMPPRAGSSTHVDYGTMLEIRSVQILEDGRSLLETWGTWRFRLVEKGLLDGYMVGRVERIDDFPDNLDVSIPVPMPKPLGLMIEKPGSPSSLTPSRPGSASVSEKSSPKPSRQSSPGPVEKPKSGSGDILTTTPSTSLESMAAYSSFSTQALIKHCLKFLIALKAGSAPWVSQRLAHAYDFAGLGIEALLNETLQEGDMDPLDFSAAFPDVGHPEPARIINPDGAPNSTSNVPTGTVKPSRAVLSFYIASLLPIDEYEKARLFPIRSAKMRLQMCVWWIEGLRRHWWFERGCTVL